MNPMRDINKSSGVCEEKVWSGRPSETEPKLKCGSTGWNGDVVFCGKCEAEWDKKYSNGMPYYPEDDYDDGILQFKKTCKKTCYLLWICYYMYVGLITKETEMEELRELVVFWGVLVGLWVGFAISLGAV